MLYVYVTYILDDTGHSQINKLVQAGFFMVVITDRTELAYSK